MLEALKPIMIELTSIRYLINNLLIAQYQQKQVLKLLLEKEKIKLPKPKKFEENPIIDAVKFNMFVMSRMQYDELVNEFGYDIVCRACAMLDDYVREKGFIPYGKPVMALRKVLIVNALKEKLDAQKEGRISYKSIDYEVIDNKKDALDYINSVPPHIRNLEPSVQMLRAKFNLDDSDGIVLS